MTHIQEKQSGPPEVMLGLVKAKKAQKRLGFIVVEGVDEDVMFHSSYVRGGDAAYDALEPGDAVVFIPYRTGKGLQAIGVSKLEEQEQ